MQLARPRTFRNLALIAAGYLAAFGAGVGAVWLKNLGVSEADQLSMSGMFAFADAVTFCAAGSLVAIFPTLLLFWMIGPAPRFWRAYSLASLLAASTGLGMVLLSPLSWGIHMVTPLRVLAAPAFFLGFAPGLLPWAGRNRRLTVIAYAVELAGVILFFVVMFALSGRYR